MLLLIFLSVDAWSAKTDPLATAADYYFARQDYAEALRLWKEVWAKDATNDAAALKVAQLELLNQGRAAARAVLVRQLEALDREERGERDDRRALIEKWREIEGVFLTEEGQALYLQAKEKETQGDCAAALAIVSRAVLLEKGNLELLRFRATCERRTESFPAYYETLKSADVEFPFDSELKEELAEAHLQFKQPQKVVDLFAKEEGPPGPRRRLALAFAHLDLGEDAKAAHLVGKPNEVKSGGATLPWLYAQGLLASRKGATSEALAAWKSFLERLEHRAPAPWDPYRLKERAVSARAWVEAKEPPKSGLPVTKNVSG